MKPKRSYLQLGATVFLTVAALLLFYDTLFGNRAVVVFGGKLYEALKPIFYGAMIAYLLAPVINFFDVTLFPAAVAKAKNEKRLYAPGPRAVSLVITFVLLSVCAYLLLSILLPELYRSVLQLAANMENYYNTITAWIQHLLEQNPGAETLVTEKVDAYYQSFLTWLTGKVLPQAQQVVTAVSGGLLSLVTFAKNVVVGIIVSVYLLGTKERLSAHARKLVYGLFSRENTAWILRGAHKVDDIFSGFVRGKLLDSLIIGLICFAGCAILKFPYTVLISFIVGITNVVPFFGPFLGAIPSLFLILLDSPLKALYFLIFILALQQVDGNIIGPKILGGRTGLSSLWVITAILVGGSFFGIPGMFFGVPVFACLYTAVAFLINTRLRKRDLPLTAEAYRTDTPEGGGPGREQAPKPESEQKP